ncbi:MAG: cytosine/creatinine deaminase [Actinomycetota bacterium]|jgi:cytosine deaminase|nr:cytosine/creatinine deaminase [Actinomycetota bacterium]
MDVGLSASPPLTSTNDVSLVLSGVSTLDGRTVDVAIGGGMVRAIGTLGAVAAGPGTEIVAGHGRLCVRPVTDAHLHLDKAGTAASDAPPCGSVMEAIAAMRAVKERARDDDTALRERMRAVARRVAASGTGCARVDVDVDEIWGLLSFRAAVDLREALRPWIDLRVVAFPQDGMTPHVADLLREAAADADAIGAHTDIDADVVAHMRTAAAIAREADLPLEVHTDEGAAPDLFFLPVVLDEAGDLDLTLVHCLSLATLDAAAQDRWIGEIAALPRARVTIAPSAVAYGSPVAPLRRLVDAGVAVAFGTDNLHDLFNPLGTGRMFEIARQAALVGGVLGEPYAAAVVAGISDLAYQAATGVAAAIEVGSPATFDLLEATNAVDVLRGVDGVAARVRAGLVVAGAGAGA